MLTIVLDVIATVFVFGVGAVVGATNAPTVDKAIAAVEAAEKSAQATLAKITAHKAP